MEGEREVEGIVRNSVGQVKEKQNLPHSTNNGPTWREKKTWSQTDCHHGNKVQALHLYMILNTFFSLQFIFLIMGDEKSPFPEDFRTIPQLPRGIICTQPRTVCKTLATDISDGYGNEKCHRSMSKESSF